MGNSRKDAKRQRSKEKRKGRKCLKTSKRPNGKTANWQTANLIIKYKKTSKRPNGKMVKL